MSEIAVPSITCPACRKRFKGKAGLEGKRIKCPLCAEPFVVPAAEKAPAKAEKPAAKAEVKAEAKSEPKPIGFEEAKDDAAYGVGRIDTAPRCPNCAKEMLNDLAIICVHCGYNTLTRTHGETKKVIAATPMEHFMYLLPALGAAAGFLGTVIWLVFHSTYMLEWLQGSKGDWMVHESIRMWETIVLLAFLWALGMYAFSVLALRPKPPEVEKE